MENKKDKIRAIFIGTPDFAVPGLESLLSDDFFDLSLVITQIDKKIGRKQIISEPAIKKIAKNKRLNILQPIKISDAYDAIKTEKPDIIIVIAYGQIIPKNILELPKFGCINLHASLLPKFRGAACIQGAILALDKKTGLTFMKMDEGLDTGPIIFQETIEIGENDTCGDLFERLAKLSAELLPTVLKKYISGDLKPIEQDNKMATLVRLIKKEDGQIICTEPAKKIKARIMAMTPWPGAYLFRDDVKIKIIEVGDIVESNSNPPGAFIKTDSELLLQCADASLQIKKIQVAGKNIILASDFIKGYAKYLN